MFFGAFYWAVWRVILPKLGRYTLIPAKESLDDGTIVMTVSVCLHAVCSGNH